MISPAATILIVDGKIQDRKLLEALLRPEGYLTLSAANGEEALASIAQRAPDLILLDILMLGMDGYQVASLLKANPATSNIPIIMVTAQIDRSARLAGLNAGVEEFLTKPVDRTELWIRVRNLLRLKALGDFLQNHSRILEQQVQARTADLQTANSTLQTEKARQEVLIRKLEEAQNQLLQSEKMASIGQLAAGVAHEINNPISFVNSNLGALQRYTEDMLKLLAAYERIEASLAEDVLQDIKQMKKDIDVAFLREDVGNLLSESLDGLQRVKRTVQDLKDFSHVDESERQWADLEMGLESTLRVVWNELKYKADVVKEYGAITQIECFPSQLNQVFMNLLVNASHAIEDHGRITIRTGQDGGNVWVEVEDSGKGIEPEDLGRIFEPFFTTKAVGKGTGLGLSLSYGIVQKHNGRIDVQTEVRKGTTFRVTLPVKHDNSERR